jgi:hypothetical protein
MSTHDDELIDRAAHAMTRGEPSDRLRHTVRARIEAGRPGSATRTRHRAWWHLPAWVPASAAVMAVVIVGVIAAGRAWLGPPDTPRPTAVVGRTLSGPPAPTPGLRESTARPGLPPAGVRESSARPAPRRTPQRRLEVEPLVIEPIRMPLIAIDSSSGVMPIEIEDLRIEPLQVQ